MSQTKNRVEGAVQEVAGKVQKAIGGVLGDETTEAKGRANELSGHDKQETAKTIDRVQGKGEELLGKAKAAVGDLFGDKSTELEGEAKALEGQARQAANKPAPKPV